MHRIVFIATLAVLLGSCANPAESQHDARARQDQFNVPKCSDADISLLDYDVLAAVLAHIVTTSSCKPGSWKEILLADTIGPSSHTTNRTEILNQITPLGPKLDAVDNLICRNQQTTTLLAPPSSSIPRHLLHPSEIGDLDQLMQSYPNASALVNLSIPGYDITGTQAVVYYAKACGSLSAEGFYAIVERGPNGWTVVRSMSIWIA